MRLLQFACCCSLLVATGTSCGLTELRDRENLLQAMCATNAPLSAVESRIGHVPIYRRGSQEWNSIRDVYARHLPDS